jgi:hypothetical protein
LITLLLPVEPVEVLAQRRLTLAVAVVPGVTGQVLELQGVEQALKLHLL